MGDLPDGEYQQGETRRAKYNKGLRGKHQPLISMELWEAAQRAKALNSARVGRTISNNARIYSLGSLLVCGYCGGKIHIHTPANRKPKAYCYKRSQGNAPECRQRSTYLAIYEKQVEQYLDSIKLPDNYHQIILDAYKQEDEEGPGYERQRRQLEGQLARLKELYQWGDIPAEDYVTQRDQLRGEIAALPPRTDDRKGMLERLAKYLNNIGDAWRDANPEQRNTIVRTLFESIRIQDDKIIGVTPTAEFTPLLILNSYHSPAVKEVVGGAEATGFAPSCTSSRGGWYVARATGDRKSYALRPGSRMRPSSHHTSTVLYPTYQIAARFVARNQ